MLDMDHQRTDIEDDVKFWVAFQGIDGMGPKRINNIETHFGNLEDAWNAGRNELRDAGIGPSLIDDISITRDRIDPDHELGRLLRKGIRPIHLRSDEYPELLANSPDAPAVIYVAGDWQPQDQNCVAIVGTRQATDYGLQMATTLARDLASLGVTIVSGLAMGIDTAAHRGALQSDGRTVAVLAGGLDSIYPSSNRGLARQIVESGCLVSEYQLGVRSKRDHFPRRNRIISGLCRGVIVVEARKKSGATWTVKWALDQNREVFAVPGNATSPQSEGTNWLIKNGAKLTTSADDVIEELSAFFGDLRREPEIERRQANKSIMSTVTAPSAEPSKPAYRSQKPTIDEIETFNEKEHAIATVLLDADEPMHVDEVARTLKASISDVMSTLTMMEVRGTVHCTEGSLYELSNRRAEIGAPRLLDQGQPAR